MRITAVRETPEFEFDLWMHLRETPELKLTCECILPTHNPCHTELVTKLMLRQHCDDMDIHKYWQHEYWCLEEGDNALPPTRSWVTRSCACDSIRFTSASTVVRISGPISACSTYTGPTCTGTFPGIYLGHDLGTLWHALYAMPAPRSWPSNSRSMGIPSTSNCHSTLSNDDQSCHAVAKRFLLSS